MNGVEPSNISSMESSLKQKYIKPSLPSMIVKHTSVNDNSDIKRNLTENISESNNESIDFSP